MQRKGANQISSGTEGEPVARLSYSCAALALETPCVGRLLQTSKQSMAESGPMNPKGKGRKDST